MDIRWKPLFFFLLLSLLVACSDNESNSPPKVLRTVPAAGSSQIPTTTTLSVTFNESAQPEFPDDVLTLDPAVAGEVTYNADQRTLYFSPNSELSFDTTYTVTLAAGIADLEGLATDKRYTWTFSTASAPDVTKPQVQGTTPADGASGIALSSAITATLTEPVDTQSVSEGSIELSGGSSIVTGTISVSDSNIVFQPASPLAGETTYTATLSGDVADLAGNTLGSQYIWTFTTGPEPDTISPTVSSKTPADGTIDASLDTAIRVTFSEDVDPSTVNAVTFSVASAENSVTGNFQVNGSEAIFTPEADLTPLSAYTVTLTTGIQDLSGNSLSSETSWIFTTAATAVGPAWGSPVRISAEGIPTDSFRTFTSNRAKIALDSSGNGFAIWQQENEIWGSRYLAATGWSEPFAITASGVDAGYPDLSVNGRGDAVVIWTEYSSTEDATYLLSRFFKPDTGWAEILPLPSQGLLPRVVIDEKGNATAGWQRSKPHPDGVSSGRTKTVGINHYTPGIGWRPEILLEDLDFGSALDDYPDKLDSVATPTLIVGPDDSVHAVWVKNDNDYYLRHAHGTSSGWSTPTDVHVTSEYIYPFVKGVIDSAGNLLLAILENTPYDPVAPGTRLLQTVRGTIGSGWELPTLITKAPDLADPGLAMDDSGNAMIVWREKNDTNREDILSRIYSLGEGWSAAEFVETFDRFTAQYYTTDRPAEPSVAALGNGEFLAAWHQRGEISGSALYANRYSISQGWETPEIFLDNDNSLYSSWPLLSSDPTGKALMIWGQSTDETWSMEYK